jgi:hypothetical protein
MSYSGIQPSNRSKFSIWKTIWKYVKWPFAQLFKSARGGDVPSDEKKSAKCCREITSGITNWFPIVTIGCEIALEIFLLLGFMSEVWKTSNEWGCDDTPNSYSTSNIISIVVSKYAYYILNSQSSTNMAGIACDEHNLGKNAEIDLSSLSLFAMARALGKNIKYGWILLPFQIMGAWPLMYFGLRLLIKSIRKLAECCCKNGKDNPIVKRLENLEKILLQGDILQGTLLSAVVTCASVLINILLYDIADEIKLKWLWIVSVINESVMFAIYNNETLPDEYKVGSARGGFMKWIADRILGVIGSRGVWALGFFIASLATTVAITIFSCLGWCCHAFKNKKESLTTENLLRDEKRKITNKSDYNTFKDEGDDNGLTVSNNITFEEEKNDTEDSKKKKEIPILEDKILISSMSNSVEKLYNDEKNKKLREYFKKNVVPFFKVNKDKKEIDQQKNKQETKKTGVEINI